MVQIPQEFRVADIANSEVAPTLFARSKAQCRQRPPQLLYIVRALMQHERENKL